MQVLSKSQTYYYIPFSKLIPPIIHFVAHITKSQSFEILLQYKAERNIIFLSLPSLGCTVNDLQPTHRFNACFPCRK
jgi:hypothetical protein